MSPTPTEVVGATVDKPAMSWATAFVTRKIPGTLMVKPMATSTIPSRPNPPAQPASSTNFPLETVAKYAFVELRGR